MRREFLIIVNVAFISMIVGGGLYYFAPSPQATHTASDGTFATVSSASAKDSQTISFDILDIGTRAAGVTARKNYAAYSKEDFAKIWKMAHGTDRMPIPTVDFSKNFVIGVFSGKQSTGGHTIEVAKVTDIGNIRTVAVALTSPGQNCIVTEALTNPYQIIVVPFTYADLTHEDISTTVSCS